ncbi:MAG: (2Fe-2S)-binding protein [Chloroflexota bacterium]|nr:MAG: (2Fe-2S)-binding protein [Chloroflexota bacterium]
MKVWLHVFPKDIWVPAQYGETIWAALRRANIELDSDCGGAGNCGKCKIKVLSVVDPPTKAGQKLLDKDALQEGFRLA